MPQAIRLASSSLTAPPENVTPAFDSANSGSTRNETQSFSLRVMRSESASVAFTSCSKLPSRRFARCHVTFSLRGPESLHHVDADLLKLLQRKAG